MNKSIEELKEELSKYIEKGTHRYEHSIAVAEQAKLYAEAHGLDTEKAQKIGLMHDIAKYMSDEDSLQYVKDNNIELDEDEMEIVDILHGPIAADICKKKYGFDDEMCEAIKNHTTAKAGMGKLAELLYCADKTDTTRKYNDVEDYRKLAFESLEECTYAIIVWYLNAYREEGKEPLEKTKKAYEYYKKLLNKN